MAFKSRAFISKLRRSALCLVLLTLAGPAVAQTNSLVDIRVVNRDTGETLRTWVHDGRLYVAGDPGTRYGLRFTNHTGRRVLAVVSVDGVNILTGETANYNERGYVLAPWETADVNGWRKSETTIADFQFAPLSASYAARTGRPGDVGVIGMAVFEERKAPLASDMIERAPNVARAAPAPAAVPPAARGNETVTVTGTSIRGADEKLGTGHGASEWSVIQTVNFVRATNAPQAITAIEYDTWDHLVAKGVIPSNASGHPRAFPGEPRL
jgi:hypothetical protein